MADNLVEVEFVERLTVLLTAHIEAQAQLRLSNQRLLEARERHREARELHLAVVVIRRRSAMRKRHVQLLLVRSQRHGRYVHG